MGDSFEQSETFAVIANVIVSASLEPGQFLNHQELVEKLITDERGSLLIKNALQSSIRTNEKHVVSNMIAWFSQKITVGSSPWCDFFDRRRFASGWAYRPAEFNASGITANVDLQAIEGDPRMFFHFRRERDRAIVRAKFDAVLREKCVVACEACDFETGRAFPNLEAEICEVHHKVPLASVVDVVITQIDDLAILCPNCHRAIHKTKPMMTVEEFRKCFKPSLFV